MNPTIYSIVKSLTEASNELEQRIDATNIDVVEMLDQLTDMTNKLRELDSFEFEWQINDVICLKENGYEYYGKIARIVGDTIFCTFGTDDEIPQPKQKLVNLNYIK